MKKNKNISVLIEDGLNSIPVQAQKGDLLLDVLRRSGKPLTAPCGGKGTCGKCRVDINNTDSALACQFIVRESIRVTLPSQKQFAILEKEGAHVKTIANDSGIEIVNRGEFVSVSYKGQEFFAGKSENSATDKLGLAIDIGSTTVVIFLEDLTTFEVIDVASFVNPQTAYGSDVISRITYCIEQTDGVMTLQRRLIEAINAAILQLCRKNNISSHNIYKTAFVGNTVMLHLLLGVDPRSIAFAPYTPVFIEEKQISAMVMNLSTHPKGIVKILPSIAGYVGADIVAGVATTDILERDAYALYIDIGTNGEIVLGNKDKIYCCATAAGPAFEGANIECGVGGVSGAISEYDVEEFTTIGHAPPIGICGSGLIDIVAVLLDQGQIDMMGYMEKDFLIVPKDESGINQNIVLTPNDVREVQLAKSAIYAGIITLMKIANIFFDDIERLYLAGGFGNYIRVESGVRIGMIPHQLKDKIIPIGNSAGTGARFALKSVAFEKDIRQVVEKSEYIELSMRQDFNETYVEAMMFA